MESSAFLATADRLADLQQAVPLDRAWGRIAPVVRTGFDENFFHARASDGSPWPPHAPLTIAIHGPHPLLILSGAMLESMTNEGAPGNVTRVQSDQVELGTAVVDPLSGLAYPVTHQEGAGRVPQREFCYASEEVLAKCDEIILDEMDRLAGGGG